jgi:hypothetical protein
MYFCCLFTPLYGRGIAPGADALSLRNGLLPVLHSSLLVVVNANYFHYTTPRAAVKEQICADQCESVSKNNPVSARVDPDHVPLFKLAA